MAKQIYQSKKSLQEKCNELGLVYREDITVQGLKDLITNNIVSDNTNTVLDNKKEIEIDIILKEEEQEKELELTTEPITSDSNFLTLLQFMKEKQLDSHIIDHLRRKHSMDSSRTRQEWNQILIDERLVD